MYNKKYYQKYKDVIKEKKKKYYLENRDTIINKQKKRYLETYKKKRHKDYKITKDGTVIGLNGKEIGKANSNGYTYVTINGKQILRHRLIWITFNGEIPNGYEIDHIIPVKNGGTDALSNLRLVTHKENCNNENSIENYKNRNN